jgi:hypothetical protein
MTLAEEQREAIRAVSDLPRAIGCTQCHSYIQEHYGNQFAILRAMIDSSDHIREPPKMIGFDLERARGLRDFLQDDCAEVGDVWAEMIAEIERLRGEMENYGDDYVCQMKSKDARIQELKADLEQSERVIEARLDVIDQQAARIKELEADNQNLVTLNKSLMNNDWILRDNNRKYRKRAQKAELLNKELKSKIGPDARPKCDHAWQAAIEERGYQTCLKCGECRNIEDIPRTPAWQITEDRVTAIDQGLRFLEWSNAKTGNVETKKRIAILKTMLEEASDEHGFER